MNNWSITGNLGRDPELKVLGSGDSVLNLNVAVQRRVKRDGAWVNEALWVGVSLFGKRAESLSRILRKGNRIGAVGELNVREYTTREGIAKTAIELLARDVEPLDGRRDGDGTPGQAAPRSQGSAPPSSSDSFGDDDLPF